MICDNRELNPLADIDTKEICRLWSMGLRLSRICPSSSSLKGRVALTATSAVKIPLASLRN